MSSVFLWGNTRILLKNLLKKEILLNPKDKAIFFTGSLVDFSRDLASIRMMEAMTSKGVFPATFFIVEQKCGKLSPRCSA